MYSSVQTYRISLARAHVCYPRSEKSRAKSIRRSCEERRTAEDKRKSVVERKREKAGGREKDKRFALSKQRDLSLAKGQRATRELHTDIAVTMGPFVLCSAFLITPPPAPHDGGHPANPLRSRKDRESGLCNDDEGKKHAYLMHRDLPLSKTRGFDNDNLSKRFSQRNRARATFQFCPTLSK